MKFNEAKLEQAIIELLGEQGFPNLNGGELQRNSTEVLIKEDLSVFFKKRYQHANITDGEIKTIIDQLTNLSASDLYDSNKTFCKWLSDGFLLKRESGSVAGSAVFLRGGCSAIKLPNTKIKLLQQMLAKAIGDLKKVNQVQGIDFTKRFQALVERYNERKEEDVLVSDVLEEFSDSMVDLIYGVQKEMSSGDELGIDIEEKAFYDALKSLAVKYDFDYPEEKLIELAKAVKQIVDDKAKFTDWNHRDDIKATLKVELIMVLAKFGYPPISRDEVYKEIFEQAQSFKANKEMV
ncbi:MAG: DUF3387 domain-containing protein [Colwellia sp.]